MTLKLAKQRLAAVGCTISKRDGEYCVRFAGAKPGDGSGYFTNDINDAVSTGVMQSSIADRRAVLRANVNRCIAAGSPVFVEQGFIAIPA